MKGCEPCQKYAPHEHPERLTRMPNDKTIFVCEDGDVAFARREYMEKIIEVMRQDTRKDRVFILQSKSPSCFKQYLNLLPENTYLDTTLETNRDDGYDKVSKAPRPTQRYKDFLDIEWKRKMVTVEPIMDFDLDTLPEWIISIKPKAVFVGYNQRPKSVPLPEPSWDKTLGLMSILRDVGIQVLPKLIPKYAYKDAKF